MENGKKLVFIVNTASFDRVAFALNVANAAAAEGQEVELLFGYGGLLRLKKGATDQVGEETAPWVRDTARNGLAQGRVAPISELLESLLEMGGKLYACPAAMAFHNVARNELVEDAQQVCGLAEFLGQNAGKGATILYV